MGFSPINACRYIYEDVLRKAWLHPDHQEASRCVTRGVSEESIACRRKRHASKESILALKPGEDVTSPKVTQTLSYYF